MPSKIFGEDRTVLVHTPKGNGRFPVLYLLDGASNFDMMVSITEYLSSEGFCPAMMVVGIGSGRCLHSVARRAREGRVERSRMDRSAMDMAERENELHCQREQRQLCSIPDVRPKPLHADKLPRIGRRRGLPGPML